MRMFAMRFSGVVGIWGPKRWFCKMALCDHGRSSKLTGIWSCSIGQSACGIVNDWMLGNGCIGGIAL